MAQSKTNELKHKTQAVYQQVQTHEEHESIVQALERTEELASKADSSEALRQALNVETAHLRDVIASKTRLQETVGTLIAGYDTLTSALGGQIDSMKEMTAWESLIGFFSSKAARDMREKRVQEADIDVQLQDLVAQTHAIGSLLTDHMESLNAEYATVGNMLERQQNELKTATDSFESTERELDTLNVEIGEKREALAELTGSARADADQALQSLINRANELTEVRNTALSNAQTHEVFIENHKIALDSLMRQKAAQRILIDKLRISTENRIIQYAATVESLKTAAQQESAHSLHEIGTEVDEATSKTMAAIGAAADRSIVEMLERHVDDVQKRRITQAEVARARSMRSGRNSTPTAIASRSRGIRRSGSTSPS
jgi:hypothetical protein